MRLSRTWSLLAMVVLAGCGSHASGSLRPAASWCKAIPSLSSDPTTDLTGSANTAARVRRVVDHFGITMLHRCPGVVAVGVGNLRVERALAERTRLPPGSVRPQDEDYILSVGLRSAADAPSGPLFLDGVRLLLTVTGPIHALGSGVSRPLSR